MVTVQLAPLLIGVPMLPSKELNHMNRLVEVGLPCGGTVANVPAAGGLKYEPPTISSMALSGVIAGAGGSQNDDDFTTTKTLDRPGPRTRKRG